jgi:DNA repair exonuclease SbcCD nuclease subunit
MPEGRKSGRMGLKILHSADWHLDSPFVGFTEYQRRILQEAQRKIPGKVADLCRREDCDLLLLAGDIFDGEARQETVDLLKRELENCGVPVLISPGNHDFCNVTSPWRSEDWPENVFVFTGARSSGFLAILNTALSVCCFRLFAV